MKTIFKNVTLLPEYGYGNKPIFVVVEDRKITEIAEKIPDLTEAEVVECNGNLFAFSDIAVIYKSHRQAPRKRDRDKEHKYRTNRRRYRCDYHKYSG